MEKLTVQNYGIERFGSRIIFMSNYLTQKSNRVDNKQINRIIIEKCTGKTKLEQKIKLEQTINIFQFYKYVDNVFYYSKQKNWHKYRFKYVYIQGYL